MTNIFQKFKDGFKKTTSNFSKGIKDIVVKKEIDDKTCLLYTSPSPRDPM